jgi:hypothetical protein
VNGFKTYEEARAYAEKLMEPCSIMYGKTYVLNDDGYHVIRQFGVEHWRQHLKEIAVCVPELKVTRV